MLWLNRHKGSLLYKNSEWSRDPLTRKSMLHFAVFFSLVHQIILLQWSRFRFTCKAYQSFGAQHAQFEDIYIWATSSDLPHSEGWGRGLNPNFFISLWILIFECCTLCEKKIKWYLKWFDILLTAILNRGNWYLGQNDTKNKSKLFFVFKFLSLFQFDSKQFPLEFLLLLSEPTVHKILA